MELSEPSKLSELPDLVADPQWAWSTFVPSDECPWSTGLAAHLYRRAGFGAPWPVLRKAVALGPQRAVDRLLQDSEQSTDGADSFERWMAAAARSGNGATYVAWWLRRFLETPSVLREKMTLFWHGTFAVGLGATGDLPLFHRHVETLRGMALSSVDALLSAELSDPAVWVALGGTQNRRSRPNMTFARPWVETFTVGPDLTSEALVREVARSLTGWFVYGGRLRWIEREHDRGEKRVFGRVGPLTREDVVAALAGHPATVRTMARRLFRWLISETALPSDALLAPLEERLRKDRGIREVVELILRSNLFFSEHSVGQKLKSPVEMTVGLGRAFDTVLPTQSMAQDLVRLGQQLDEPPTVRGWTGGTDWINSMTIVARQRWCLSTLDGEDGYGKGLDPWRSAVAFGCKTESEAEQLWENVLLPRTSWPENLGTGVQGLATPGMGGNALKESVRRLLLDPRFQIN